jgi:hypothetical protein
MTDTQYLTDAQLDAIAALDVNLGSDASIQAAADNAKPSNANLPSWLGPCKAVLDDETDLHLELRRLTPKYLDAREAFEETSDPSTQAANEYKMAGEALVHVLVAIGAYDTDTAAAAAVQALTFPFGSDMLVSRWAHREKLLTHLGSGEIARIAMSVEDRIAAGYALDDLPMWELADPYLTGGEL